MTNETYICENCGATGHLRHLRHRQTMPGDYCPACGDMELCAACGEVFTLSELRFKTDVDNYICDNCIAGYRQVAEYITPLRQVSAGQQIQLTNTQNRAA